MRVMWFYLMLMLKTELTDNLLDRDFMAIWMIWSGCENPSDECNFFLDIPLAFKDIKDSIIAALWGEHRMLDDSFSATAYRENRLL